MTTEDDRSRVLDPFLNLSLPSPATSLCFVEGRNNPRSSNESEYDDSDSDSSEDLAFRSSSLIKTTSSAFKQQQRQNLLKDRLLVSCHQNGEARIWDCFLQKTVSVILSDRVGAGMAVKRLDDPTLIMYQTRDANGTVSIHSIERFGSTSSVVRQYETYSATFCHATPCRGNVHLIALPTRQETVINVMDDRDRVPIFATTTSPMSNHGMVTSIAMSDTESNRPVLVCGMESGSVIFHDFSSGRSVKGEYNLTKDPILALDLVPSSMKSHMGGQSHPSPSVVAAVGMAGDSIEVAELPVQEQGRVALLRAEMKDDGIEVPQWTIRTRARLSTCRVDNDDSSGKPGVSICRFRPDDGRLFAVGGWDNRVRLFERSNGTPLAILRGHVGSVNAMDWARDAVDSGLLATAGGEDATISFWQCYGQL